MGAITGYIDVAQVTLYAFWIFFAGLVFYLQRESKREGYPLVSDRSDRASRVTVQGFPAVPPPKTFHLPHGGTYVTPGIPEREGELRASPVEGWPGAPLHPTGNPMLDGVGPASYAARRDEPEMAWDNKPNIIPLRLAHDFSIDPGDTELRGMEVAGADKVVAGTVTELWVDRSEPKIYYLEVDVTLAEGGRKVLLPMTLARIDRWHHKIMVQAILGRQFADVPGLKNPDQVTKLEEDKITGYYAGGKLYAEPSRLWPVL